MRIMKKTLTSGILESKSPVFRKLFVRKCSGIRNVCPNPLGRILLASLKMITKKIQTKKVKRGKETPGKLAKMNCRESIFFNSFGHKYFPFVLSD